MSVVGAGIGLVLALAGRRIVATSLYDVTAGDPATLALVTLTLLGVAFAACWIPARRAARTDPMTAIRAD